MPASCSAVGPRRASGSVPVPWTDRLLLPLTSLKLSSYICVAERSKSTAFPGIIMLILSQRVSKADASSNAGPQDLYTAMWSKPPTNERRMVSFSPSVAYVLIINRPIVVRHGYFRNIRGP